MTPVIKIINSICTKANEIRWLSRGKILCFLFLLSEIKAFMETKEEDHPVV